MHLPWTGSTEDSYERQTAVENGKREWWLTEREGCSQDLHSFDALTQKFVNHIYSM